MGQGGVARGGLDLGLTLFDTCEAATNCRFQYAGFTHDLPTPRLTFSAAVSVVGSTSRAIISLNWSKDGSCIRGEPRREQGWRQVAAAAAAAAVAAVVAVTAVVAVALKAPPANVIPAHPPHVPSSSSGSAMRGRRVALESIFFRAFAFNSVPNRQLPDLVN